MRPLRLELEGLRSYRTRQEIDFRDKNLVAIVGNTGAGKSSILEAIVYALYNASTWDERSVESLIADGQAKMEVVLDFETGGRTWRVTRATCRGGQPPSRHKLVCLSDDAVPAVTQERAIKKEISRILGLTYDGFKSAILLPQGQFQALLTAKDRTGILKEVFRLDVQVDAIRRGATDALGRVVQQLDATSTARGRLLEDPAASAGEAEVRRLAAERGLSTAKDLAARYDEAKAAAEKAMTESTALARRRARVAEVLKGDAAVLAQLLTIQGELQARRSQLEQRQKEASSATAELAVSLKSAEDQGDGLAALSTAESVLGRLRTDLPALAAEAERLVEEEQAIETAADALEAAVARSAELAEEVAASENKLGEATSAVTEAISTHNEVKLRLAAVRRAEAEGLEAERQVADAQARLVSTARELAARYDEAVSAAEKAAGGIPSTQRPGARKTGGVDRTVPLSELVGIQEEIQSARKRLEQLHKETAAEAAALAVALKAPEDQGEGLVALSAAESVLGRLQTDLPALASESQRLIDEQNAILADATALDAADAHSFELAAAVVASETTLKEAMAAVTEASSIQSEVRIRLAAARRAEAEAAIAEQQAAEARTRLVRLETAAQTRAEAHRQAVHLSEVTQAEFETAQRLHAAAHAAAGLHGGDACPICTRALPDTFVPPPGDDGRAQARNDAAQKAAADAQGLRIQAETDLDAARRMLQEGQSAAEGRRKGALEALGALRALLPSADLAITDAAILILLVDAERGLRAALETAQKARDRALAHQQAHGGSLAPARKNLSERRKKYHEVSEAFGERSRLVDRERESLPEAYRLPTTAPAALVQDALSRVQEQLKRMKDLADRHERATRARDEVAGALSSEIKQEADVEGARSALSEKESAAASRRKEVAKAFDVLRAVLPSADQAAPDATNLAPLVTAANALRAAQGAAQKTRDAALTRQREYEGSLVPARKNLRERRVRFAEASETLAKRSRIVERERYGLPDAYRPPAGAVSALVEQAQERVQQRLKRLKGLTERHERAAKARDEAGHGLSALAKEEDTRVTAHDRVAWPRLLVLADRAAEAGVDIGLLPPAAPSGDTPLPGRAVWASGLEGCVLSQMLELQRRAEEAAGSASRAGDARDRILSSGGYSSRDDIEKVWGRLSAEALAARTDERKALSQVPLARALDERIAPGIVLRDALMALTRLLNDGKFVRFVVERRQQALLAVASTILKSMTGNRYGFAADFRVVDMVTNQARPVETLSGGETFLASLALALGLVELAGRSGGRVDSLILDEGFASLDSAALTCALDELARRAGSGKLVALVSHLGAVADMAPEVLYVLQRDGSSVARWRDDAEDDPELDSVDAYLHRN